MTKKWQKSDKKSDKKVVTMSRRDWAMSKNRKNRKKTHFLTWKKPKKPKKTIFVDGSRRSIFPDFFQNFQKFPKWTVLDTLKWPLFWPLFDHFLTTSYPLFDLFWPLTFQKPKKTCPKNGSKSGTPRYQTHDPLPVRRWPKMSKITTFWTTFGPPFWPPF